MRYARTSHRRRAATILGLALVATTVAFLALQVMTGRMMNGTGSSLSLSELTDDRASADPI